MLLLLFTWAALTYQYHISIALHFVQNLFSAKPYWQTATDIACKLWGVVYEKVLQKNNSLNQIRLSEQGVWECFVLWMLSRLLFYIIRLWFYDIKFHTERKENMLTFTCIDNNFKHSLHVLPIVQKIRKTTKKHKWSKGGFLKIMREIKAIEIIIIENILGDSSWPKSN